MTPRPGPVRAPLSPQVRGTLITVAGVAVLSPDAALVHLVGVDTATMVFWRGVGLGLVLGAVVLATRGVAGFRAVLSTGLAGLVLVVCLLLSQVAFVAGLHMTNPAHVLVLVATAPLFGALFSRFLLGEPIRPATVAAMAAALVAVAITVSAGFTGGGGNWRGDLAGLVVAVVIGLGFTLIRSLGLANAWPQFAIAGILNAILVAVFFPLEPVAPSAVPALALLVLVVLPGAFLLISSGPKLIPAPEVALIMLLETPLGALFLWLLAAEPPTPQALVGGALLIAALALHAIWVARHPLRPASAAGAVDASG